MAGFIKRLTSPTGLLYLFVVITQIGAGIYIASGLEPPGLLTLVNALGFLWIMGWWLLTDSRKRAIAWVFDLGLFLYIAWPFIMPYYLFKTRGPKGLLLVLGFIAIYVGAAMVGLAVYMLLAPQSWPIAI